MLHGRKDYNDRIQDTSHIIPENEPVFLLRAQDSISLHVLMYYLELLGDMQDPDTDMVQAVHAQIERFARWERVHHDRMKCPDIPPDAIL